MLSVEVLDDVQQLAQLEEQWLALLEQCPNVTPFHLPKWLLTWWDYFGNGQLRVLTFWDRHVLRAVIPMFRHIWEGRRQLTLIGTGITDYLEPPIEPLYRNEVVQCLKNCLDAYPDWDVCDWQDLDASTALTGLGEDRRFRVRPYEAVPCTQISLAEDFDAYWEQLGPDLRRNVRRYRAKAEREGTLDFQVSDRASPETLGAFIRLHAKRWEQRGEPGVLAANGSDGFLEEIACRFASMGMLRLFTLRFKNEIAAAIISFPFRQQAFSYLSAFDPQYERLGFGNAVLYESLRYCCREGFRAWDFLRGDESYKSHWGASRREKTRIVIDRLCSQASTALRFTRFS
jgi:CelD/BcsL family acetyltransferase involved in cellulose biosynthesis